MATLRIGNQLVRSFEKNGIKVFTETVDGKTFTSVLDNTGNVIRERVSRNSASEVGDKLVLTRNKVDRSKKCELDVYGKKKIIENIDKTTTDRVYRNNVFLGQREVGYRNRTDDKLIKIYSFKTIPNPNHGIFREFTKDGIYSFKTIPNPNRGIFRDFSEDGICFGSYFLENNKDVAHVHCNNLGLPIPQSFGGFTFPARNKSIKEMQAMHLAKAPHLPYQAPGARMAHLDKRVADTPTLNNLDMYL